MTRTSGDSTQRPARKIGCGLVPAATVIGAALLWGTLPSYNPLRSNPPERGPTWPSHKPSEPLSQVKPGSRVRLRTLDPDATLGHDKASAVAATQAQMERLRDLQDRLWAEARHSVLVVLQGIDAAGKDGTIAKVMEAFNPQGCPVSSFKVPTPEELAHDFLWRVHKRTPGKGEIGIFNRSHYEDVLVVRVHGLAPRRVWSKRYEQINAFERTLAESGTTIVKFFLSIDRDEQRKRIQSRYDDPEEALEVQARGPRGAQALGRLPGRLRRRA